MRRPDITQAELAALFSYDYETGFFTRLTSCKAWKKGQRAGTVCPVGYRRINIGGRPYLAHRLAWLFVFGELPRFIDHINGNRDDNRITNLRAATQGENIANSKLNRKNKSGFKGVSWNAKQRKWAAFIGIDRGKRYLGAFDTPEEAASAYQKAAAELFGQFAISRREAA